MDELFGPPLTGAPGRVDGWVFSLDGWPLLYVDRQGAAVNDLRSTLAFGHQVWFEHLAGALPPTVVAGRTSSEARVVIGTRTIAVITLDRGRPTHVEVRVLDPSSGAPLFDREVRYRQLERPFRNPSLGASGLAR